MLSRAHQMAIVTYGEPDTWDLGGSESQASYLKFSNYYKPFLKISKDCGNSNARGCFYSGGYKTFVGENIASTENMSSNAKGFARILLSNGVAIAFWTDGTVNGNFIVDVNGVKPPNKAGIDLFWFDFSRKKGVIPSGPTAIKNCSVWCCQYNSRQNVNGARCTRWVINKGNMDYLRRDISNEW